MWAKIKLFFFIYNNNYYFFKIKLGSDKETMQKVNKE